MADTAATTGAPVQIWDCGIAGHRHLAKAEAVRCLERHEPAAATAPATTRDAPERRRRSAWRRRLCRSRLSARTPRSAIRSTPSAISAPPGPLFTSPRNARRYTAGQLERIKARIVAAWQAKIDRDGPPAAARPAVRPSGAQEPGRGRPAGAAHPRPRLARRAHRDRGGDRGRRLAAAGRLQAIIAELCDFLAIARRRGSRRAGR